MGWEKITRHLVVVFAVLFWSIAVWGQATTSLRGLVTDPSGAAIPNAPPGADERLSIWRYYARVAMAHPFGVGFNYARRFYYTTPYESGVTPHNPFLLVWMYGGLPAEIGFMLVLWIVCQSAWRGIVGRSVRGASAYYMGSVTALFGLLIFAVLGDLSFMDFTFWILMAMVLAKRGPEIPDPGSL